ncbi:MAG: ABC transporter permease [Conexivisphaerales archaeon]
MKLNLFAVFAYATLMLLVLPVILLVYWGLGPFYDSIGISSQMQRAILLSLLGSAIAVLAIVALYTPLAYYLSRNRNSLAESLVDLPAMVPHPIIGIALLVIDSPLTPTGRFLLSIGIDFFNSLPGLVVALLIVSAPLYIKSLLSFFDSLDKSPEYFARGLGAGITRVFVHVVLPRSIRGILTASLLSLSRAMSEFGSIAIVAYSVLGLYGLSGSSAASVLIYQYYTSFGLKAAVTASAAMVVVALPIMVAMRVLNRERQ